jgi:hypothetical protein
LLPLSSASPTVWRTVRASADLAREATSTTMRSIACCALASVGVFEEVSPRTFGDDRKY